MTCDCVRTHKLAIICSIGVTILAKELPSIKLQLQSGVVKLFFCADIDLFWSIWAAFTEMMKHNASVEQATLWISLITHTPFLDSAPESRFFAIQYNLIISDKSCFWLTDVGYILFTCSLCCVILVEVCFEWWLIEMWSFLLDQVSETETDNSK